MGGQDNTRECVPLLTGTNYSQWARRMGCHLVSKDMEHVVGFDPESFAPDAHAPTLDVDLKKLDRKAKALIELRLSDAILVVARTASSSHDLWKILHDTYQRSTMAALVTAIRKLMSTVKRPEQSVSEYVAAVQTNALAVTDAGVAVEEKLVVAITLANATAQFGKVLTALDTLDDVPLRKATAMLLNAEAEADSDDAPSIGANSVHALRAEITTLKEQLKHGARAAGQSTCSIPHHRHPGGDDACYVRHPELRPRNGNTPRSNAVYSVSCALSARHADRDHAVDTLADSGCSNHMFKRTEDFTRYEHTHASPIQLGDNSTISSAGRGSVSFRIGADDFTTDNVLHVPALGKNLFSLGQSTGTGTKYLLDGNHMIVYARDHFTPPTGRVLATIPKGADNLYRFPSSLAAALMASDARHRPIKRDANFASPSNRPASRALWHQRLGHLNERDLDVLIAKSADGILVQHDTPDRRAVCEACIMGKMTQFPFSRSTTRTSHAGELVLSDVKGPFDTRGIDGGWRYFVTYVDHHTRFTKVYLLRHKSEQLHAFKTYEATVTNKFQTTIKCIESFQSDNGGEYLSNEGRRYFAERGIEHRTTVAYCPQSNGIAERLNRTIMEIAEPMRTHANLPRQYWSVFVFHAVYLLNRRPHSALSGKTPFEAWWGRKPNLTHLRVAGCDAWALNPPAKRSTQDTRARRGIFVGYAPTQKAYRLWDPAKNTMIVSRSVLFDESSFTFGRAHQPPQPSAILPMHVGPSDAMHSAPVPCDDLPTITPTNHRHDAGSNRTSGSGNQPTEMDCDDDTTATNQSDDIDCDDDNADDTESQPANGEPVQAHPESVVRVERRYPTRDRRPPGEWWKGASSYAASSPPADQLLEDTCAHIRLYAASASTAAHRAPSDGLPRPSLVGIMASDIKTDISFREAITGPYGGYFSDAAHKEFKSLLHFRTFELRSLPQGRKAIGCKWIFKVKAKDDGAIDKFKARLVIQGFSQRPGIDYDETFAPVAHQESIRLLLALAAQHAYKLRHVDIVGAFLNGDMEEQVFMKQPEGFVDPGKQHMVCELLKALYGLKQAGMVWNKRFSTFLTETLRFKQLCADPCIYILRRDAKLIVLGLHVDDTLMVHNDDDMCDEVVRTIASEFEITDMGTPTRLLGMRVRRSPTDASISLDQEAYIAELLKRHHMDECHPATLPHQPGLHLSKRMCPTTAEETEEMARVPYGELVGGLLWLAINTRPDIKQAVSVLCRFVKNPGRRHWAAAELILHYLQGTRTLGLLYSRNDRNAHLEGYADSDFANDPDKSRSVSAYVIMMANGPVAWKSKLQSSVATSSVHDEYVALYEAVREVVWLRQLLRELGHAATGPTTIFEDNKGSISMASNNRTDPKTKHIDVKYHFTREHVKSNTVAIVYKPTAEMVADALTKPVGKCKFVWFRNQLGMSSLPNVDSRGRVGE